MLSLTGGSLAADMQNLIGIRKLIRNVQNIGCINALINYIPELKPILSVNNTAI